MKKIRSQTKAQQARDIIREMMEELTAGEALPSEPRLAEKLGVSRFTVSQAISALAAEGLLRRVQGKGTFVAEPAPEQISSAPLPQVQSGASRRIGLVQGRCSSRTSSNVDVLAGIQAVLVTAGYTLTYMASDVSADHMLEPDGQLEGVMLIGPVGSSIVSEVRSHALPTVLVDGYSDTPDVDSVGPDNVDGGKRATEYLIANGHSNIAFVSELSQVHGERYEGYRNAMAAAGLHVDLEPTIRDFQGVQDPRFSDLMTQSPRPSAIFAASDHSASRVIQEAYQHGIHIPLDLSIIGFNDDPIAQYISPQLTTMKIFPEQMGQEAAKLLLRRIRTPSISSAQIVRLKTELVERESVANVQ